MDFLYFGGMGNGQIKAKIFMIWLKKTFSIHVFVLQVYKVGAILRIKDKARNCSSSHCFLHRHTPDSIKMPSEHMIVLNDNIKIINFLKITTFEKKIFKNVWRYSKPPPVPFADTEDRWLYRGRTLTRSTLCRDSNVFWWTITLKG